MPSISEFPVTEPDEQTVAPANAADIAGHITQAVARHGGQGTVTA